MYHFRLLPLFLLLGSFLSVAQPSKLSLEEFSLSLQTPRGTKSLGIVVWDQRKQVVDGRQRPSLLGYKRSATGIAYPSLIANNDALADWIAQSIVDAYNSSELECTMIRTSPNDSWAQVERKFKSSGARDILVIKLNKLQFDGIAKFSYMAELDIETYSSHSILLHTDHVTDEREMGGVGGWKKKFPFHLVSILQDALNKPSILGSYEQQDQSKSAIQKANTFDIIVTKQGDEIEAKVEEITSTTIKYRKTDQIDGPLRNVPISEVFMIKYADGTKELFN